MNSVSWISIFKVKESNPQTFDEEALRKFRVLFDADANALKTGVRVFDLAKIRETIVQVLLATPVEKLASSRSGLEIMALTGLPLGEKDGELKRMLDGKVLEGQLAPDDKVAARIQISMTYMLNLPIV